MSKNLEEKFRSFCNSKNLEINKNQITTIQILEDFYNKNFHSSIFDFFKKKNPIFTNRTLRIIPKIINLSEKFLYPK